MTTIVASPTAKVGTAKPRRRWWTRVETFSRFSSARVRDLAFGGVRWDGSRATVEVREYRGEGVLTSGIDRVNPWRNPGPHAYVNIQAANAYQCRAAAKALLKAAEIIEAANR